jgi:hypothetical protein
VSSVDRRDILIIQAHPFRKNMTLAPENLVDGIEVFNLHPNHNSRVGYASRYAEDLGRCVCTCGTDFHHRGQACLTALLAREMPENEKALAKLIREEPIYKAGNAIITF